MCCKTSFGWFFFIFAENRFLFCVDNANAKVYNCVNNLVQKEIIMKRPIHLYIFVALSTIASILRIQGTFFTVFDEAKSREIFKGIEVEGVDNLVAMAKDSAAFTSNLINKGLVILLVILLAATIFFLFKKANERASYAYIAYLFGTLIYFTYAYIGSLQIAKQYQTTDIYEATKSGALINYGFNIALFVIYFGVTAFFLFRKPKETPTVSQTSTDI